MNKKQTTGLTEEAEKRNESSIIRDETSWNETPWLALKGFLMGSADIIPGVSGGTMALITGIYDRLINAVRSVDIKMVLALLKFRFREVFSTFHWKFLVILLGGIISAVFFFTRVVPLQIYMYTEPELIYGLFFGLILGSVFVLLKEVGSDEKGLKTVMALIGGSLFGFWVVTLVPTATPETFSYVFISGIFAFSAMILPGISGSYILLILGKYDYVLSQLSQLGNSDTVEAAIALLPLFLGGAIGLVVFSRLLSWLLRKYHAVTLMVLIGFLIGSLYVIWPYQDREYQMNVVNVEEYLVTDPMVQDLKESPQDIRRPSFSRLGDIVNPDAPSEDLYRIKVEHVTRKLVRSEPFIPGQYENEPDYEYSFWYGVYGFLIGLLLVGGLDYLRRKK